MAITIRNTDEHEKMLSMLKLQTNTSTLSKALLQGGYDALKYYELYQKKVAENEMLRRKVYQHERTIKDFVDSFDKLRLIADE